MLTHYRLDFGHKHFRQTYEKLENAYFYTEKSGLFALLTPKITTTE